MDTTNNSNSNISETDLNTILTQQQTAHKMLAGFYQNILQLFENTAKHLKHEFKYWTPMHHARPVGSQGNPVLSPVWNMLPLYSAMITYAKEENSKQMKTGDSVIHFELYCDGGYMGNNPEPLKISSSGAYVFIRLCKCVKEKHDIGFYQLYNDRNTQWPSEEKMREWQPMVDGIDVYSLKYSMSDFILKNEDVKKELEKLLQL